MELASRTTVGGNSFCFAKLMQQSRIPLDSLNEKSDYFGILMPNKL